jgi:hypothetical protein
MSHKKQIRKLAAQVASHLRAGELTIAQVVGLTAEEMTAMSELGAQLRRQGQWEQAASIFGLLASCDPFGADHWEALAGIQARLGRHPVAVACYEVVSLLRDSDRRLLEKEAVSLREMGEAGLARELLADAV